MSVPILQKALEQYALRPSEGQLTFDALPHVEAVVEPKVATPESEELEIPSHSSSSVPTPQDLAKELYNIPEFADLGPLFRSSKPIELTEAETEYVVTCTKHVFAEHIVLQGFDEEYPMENFEITASDMIAKVAVSDFGSAWEHIGDHAELKGSFALRYKSLVEGVAAVIDNLGMQPCGNTAVPEPKAKAHVLFLSGVFVGGIKALVKSRILLDDQSGGMILQMAVRSESDDVSQMIMDCIR
ncbi:hypothetical protein P43SY_002950 [Pythium insidiosum]|uniref:Coatomer subunit gamma n=1 Tax=Pythium insidiosum TaxID=114742 RepID=A0AAD5M2F1_PYTIN|nr:hypothetical protein P43SY_002950 [Pythium insidiosum]KAJ0403200.1 hypothetical protein ATCC90586_000171 [Pythium insidiosum]